MAADLETWKVISLSMAGISLVWNVVNTIYTHSSNEKNKTRLVNLEEFRSRIRDPLEEALRGGEAIIRELELLAQQPSFPGAFEDELESQNRALTRCVKETQDRLMDSDESRFSEDVDWLDMYDSFEDQILNHMNKALDQGKSGVERATAISNCRRSYRRFKKSVTTKIETQVEKLSV